LRTWLDRPAGRVAVGAVRGALDVVRVEDGLSWAVMKSIVEQLVVDTLAALSALAAGFHCAAIRDIARAGQTFLAQGTERVVWRMADDLACVVRALRSVVGTTEWRVDGDGAHADPAVGTQDVRSHSRSHNEAIMATCRADRVQRGPERRRAIVHRSSLGSAASSVDGICRLRAGDVGTAEDRAVALRCNVLAVIDLRGAAVAPIVHENRAQRAVHAVCVSVWLGVLACAVFVLAECTRALSDAIS